MNNYVKNPMLTDLYIHDSIIPLSRYEGTYLPKTIIAESCKVIGDSAFARTSIYELVILAKAKKIPNQFLSGSNISVLTMPDHIEEFGEGAFARTNLNKLKLPAELKEIGDSCFTGSNLKEVTFNDKLEVIGEYAFAETLLKEIDLPLGLKEIRAGAFDGALLEKVMIPPTVEKIGKYAFSNRGTFIKDIILVGYDTILHEQLIGLDAGKTTIHVPSKYKHLKELKERFSMVFTYDHLMDMPV